MIRTLKSALGLLAAALVSVSNVQADATYHNLSGGNFTQDWSNAAQITANDDWSGVPSIIGYLGDYIGTTPTNVDPQTLTNIELTSVDVIANQTNPNTNTSGGVGEFEITNPTIALQGSGTADAPFILIHLDATNRQSIQISYNLRDIDGSADNTNMQVALQYRVGSSGAFTNVSAGYVADASTGPSLATLVTPVSVTLPSAVDNQSQVQVRIMTTNAPAADEWIGVDDIVVSSSPVGTPTIASPVDGPTALFTTTYGTASAAQTFTVTGTSLTAPILATAPAGFQVSSDGVTYGTTATFTPVSGAVTGATLSVRLAANAPVTGSYNSQPIVLSSTGATSVTLTTPAADNAVAPKALQITANDVLKPFGQTLSEINPGSTAFTSSGLANDETIGSVTITYTAGFGAADPAQGYPDAVVASAATGGTFNPDNYTLTYVAGDLTVSSAPLVQVSGPLNAFSTVYGTASAAQSFTVSGSALTANLIVTAPAGYQVSLSPDEGYSLILQLAPDAGTVPPTTLYLRLRANTPAGAVAAADVTVASQDATTQTLTVPAGNVSQKELTLTGLTGNDKEYDRITEGSYTGTPVLNGVLPGDVADVTLDTGNAVAFFAQVTVGTDLVLNTSGFALTGSKAGNYTLVQPLLSADITPREIFLNDPAVTTRAFNGTTTATVTGTLFGVISPDEVTFSGTGTFANVGPGAPIAVTVNTTLGGAQAANYTLAPIPGLTGRITGSATGNTIAQWTFEGDVITPAVGTGTAALIGGTTAAFQAGNGGGRAWNLATFPAQGTASGTAGVQFAVPTTGTSGISMSFDHRGSSTPSRWARVDYSLDGGATWTENFWNNHDVANGGRATGISPDSVFYTFNVNFSSVTGADNNPNFRVRIVSMFSPVEFVANSVTNPANSAYQAAGTGSYAVGGTWRFDNVTFTGNPPFHLLSSNPAHAATGVAPTSTIQLTFSKAALLTANAVTLTDSELNPIAFTGLPVTEAATVVTLTPAGNLPYGKTFTLTLFKDEITSGGNPLEITTPTFPITFATETAVAPVVNVTPTSAESPINTPVTLTANVTAGSAPVSLQWYEGDASNFLFATLLPGETATTLVVNSATVATRSFFVRATSAAGESVNSNTVPVSFTNFVIVTATTPADNATAVLLDAPITLTFSKPVKIQAGGIVLTPAVPFTLSPGFDGADFQSSFTLTPDAPLAPNTLYTVTVDKDKVTDADTTGMSASFGFDFTTLVPVVITEDPLPQSVALNGTANFSVTVTGDGPLTYDWRLNDESLGAPSLPTLTLTNVQPSQAGNYSVVVSGPGVGNSATSVNAPLTVTIPAIPIAGTGLYAQDFDTLGTGYPLAWTGYKVAGSNTTAIGTQVTPVVGTGTANSGNVFNLGSTSAPDRALGLLASGTFTGAIGVSFRNDTAQEIDGSSVAIAFTAEQWRTSSLAALERLRFEWKVGGLVNDTTGWNAVSTFDIVEVDGNVFVNPVTNLATNGPVDGNATAYRVVLPASAFSTLSGWGPGQILHLRWVDTDDTGADAALAIDDFSFVVSDLPPPPVLTYWDANGAVTGAGGPTPTGTWGTDSFWSASAIGEAATAAYVLASDPVFSAGSDATGTFTVTLAGQQDAGSVTFQEGAVTLSGDGLLLSRLPARLDVVDGASATVASVISGSNGLSKRGAGTLNLLGSNLFTGSIRLAGGIVNISADSALGAVENDLLLAGGTLGATTSLTLPTTRSLSGSGTLFTDLNATLTVQGPVATSTLTLGNPAVANSIFSFTNVDSLNLGQLTLASPLTVNGAPATLSGLAASLGAQTATVENDLNLGASNRTFTIGTDSTVVLSGDLTLGGSAALAKLGAGTLRLTGDNSALFRVSIGTQGNALADGGRIEFNNKTALGTNSVFFNYGTLEALAPLTGADALPIGLSIGGRATAPTAIEGEDIELAGTSGLFSAGVTGDIVLLLSNTTTFSGPFAVNPNANIDALRFGGTGTAVFSGTKDTFLTALKLADTATLVLDTPQLGSSTSANPLISLASGTTLIVGGESATRLVTAYNRLTAEAGSTLAFEIGGTTRGTQYDALDFVAGTGVSDISAASTIKVTFLAGYSPQAGHAFRLLSWSEGSSVDLASVTLDLPALPAGLTWDSGNFASQGLLVISGPGMGPIIVTPPQSQSVALGADVTFTVQALGSGLNYDWKRNGVSLGAPNTNTLTLLAVDAARAGLYTVTVTNASGTTDSSAATLIIDGMPFIVTPPQSAAVVDGTPVTFSVTAFGPGTLTYQWQFNSTDLLNETNPTLNVVAGPATLGNYRVIVSAGVDKSVTSAVAILSGPTAGPPNQKPEWNFTGDLPPGQIGLSYTAKPTVKPDDPANNILRSATSFSASGLPSGLAINPQTGEITGVPAALKSTPYLIKITARNAFGSAVLSTRLLINPLPTGVAGVFTGTVARSQMLANLPNNVSGPLGGRIDFTVTSTGSVSGSITIGVTVYKFRSRVTVDPTDTTRAKMTAVIKRPKPAVPPLSDIVIDLTILGTGALANATVTDGTVAQPVAIAGWRNPWSKTNRADQASANIAGYYTLKMDLVQPSTPYTSAQAPLGVSYLGFTLSPTTGRLTLSGRLADGSAITMATFAGPAGQILLFRTLYASTARGSILGELGIELDANPALNTIGGTLDWMRPANLARTNRLYRDGFPALLNLEATGARYTAPPRRTASNPTAEPRVLGLTDANNLVEVLFTEAGVQTALPLATTEGMKGQVAINNRVTFSTDFVTINTRRATLSINPTTGSFTASIRLTEPNPLLLPGATVPVPRTVTAQGLIVGNKGEGYFVLSQLPTVTGETPANTPQQGGKIIIQPVPPPMP